MKLVTIIGARPQFIKAAALSRAIKTHNRDSSLQKVEEIIIHSGQHHDPNMSDIFFSSLEIPLPDYTLGIHNLSHGAMTGQMLEKIEQILLHEAPDVVLVYGDTNTTLAGALAAAKLHIPVAHVEAGLRSFNRAMPEEINRILTDHIAQWLFCPTQVAVKNLQAEGVDQRAGVEIIHNGDVMLDTMRYFINKASRITLDRRKGSVDGYIVCTLHRAELTDDLERLRDVFTSIVSIAKEHPVFFPLHPRTRKALDKAGCTFDHPGLEIMEPVGYLEMIDLLHHAGLVITDSGGLQKEAFFSGTPCLTIREETEWTELVEAGFNRLAGYAPESIVAGAKAMATVTVDNSSFIYGDGTASQSIIATLLRRIH
ncbi:MAG: UDP-N-acetylglucosamine 2-epimerase (non-hydrolyzing) [Magnetococcales bacterium]|nr:UDP-N-acetylglucosamine 2-epimerase (non-hydrolyzing) [Magnetococcales bacterium]